MASKRKFSSKITFSNNPRVVHHGTKLMHKVPEIALEIPQEFLIYWHTLIKDKGHNLYTYANLLDSSNSLPFTIKYNPYLEKQLNDVACLAIRECHGKSGRKKQQLLKKTRRIRLCIEDVEGCKSVAVEAENQCGDEDTTCSFDARLEVDELERKCAELYSELKTCQLEKSVIEEENAALAKHVKYIEDLNVCQNCESYLENHAKKINDVGTRQRQRKVKELTTKVDRALWFLQSYGVTAQTLSLEVTDSSSQCIDLKLNSDTNGKRISNYKDLPDEKKTKIKEVLHILDKFCVGDAAYHALTQIECGLPRSYLIKQCRGDINDCFIITRTPGDLVGAQLSFKTELRRKIKEKVGMLDTFID